MLAVHERARGGGALYIMVNGGGDTIYGRSGFRGRRINIKCLTIRPEKDKLYGDAKAFEQGCSVLLC